MSFSFTACENSFNGAIGRTRVTHTTPISPSKKTKFDLRDRNGKNDFLD
jgi:hypothetical protein